MIYFQRQTATEAWLTTVDAIYKFGVARYLSQRPGQARSVKTIELIHHTVHVDMNFPVTLVEGRKLGFKFMAAEAFWILSGDNRVSTIAPYSRHIAQFSDDGQTFFGAYGPKIMAQYQYVIHKLIDDPSTRQAVLTIWRENPPSTKDYPCTIAMDFKIVDGHLNCHVFMRSSDAWLGLPYDMFNFSMVAALVCRGVNMKRKTAENSLGFLKLGSLFLTASSSHLYEKDWEPAREAVANHKMPLKIEHSLPNWMLEVGSDTFDLLDRLWDIVSGKPNSCWWHPSHD